MRVINLTAIKLACNKLLDNINFKIAQAQIFPLIKFDYLVDFYYQSTKIILMINNLSSNRFPSEVPWTCPGTEQ